MIHSSLPKALLLLLFIFCSSLSLIAKSTVVSGRVESPEIDRVAVYYIEDYLTQKLKKIKEVNLDENDLFFIDLDIDDIQHVVIRCGNIAGKFFAEPEVRYALILTAPQEEEPLSKGRLNYVRIKLKEKKISPLNVNITRINIDIDSILIKYQKEILFNKFKEPFIESKNILNEKYAHINNQFVKDYLFYSIGVLELMAYRKSQKRIYKDYLDKKPILYSNPAYMDFFSKFYENHFRQYLLSSKNKGFSKDLEENNHFVAIRLMETDTLYKDEKIRELAVLKGIKDVYYESFVPKKDLLSLLNYLSEKGSCKQIKIISGNLHRKLSKFNSGNNMPTLSMKDIDGNKITNHDFKEKFTYYHFWAPWNPVNIQEFQLMQNLHKKYGMKVNFVSVSPYINKKELKEFIETYKYDWTFTIMDIYDEVLMDMEVNITPHFMLTYPSGRVALIPAPYPSEDAKEMLDEVVKNPKKEFTVGIK